jgi:L-rhamnose isomerase
MSLNNLIRYVLKMNASETISRLKFLKNIKIGDKIDTESISLQPDTWLTPLTRWINGEDKKKTLNFLKNTLDAALELYKVYSNVPLYQEQNLQVVKDFNDALRGIINLEDTYSTDLKFVCDLQTLSENTRMKLSAIGVHVDFCTSNSKSKESKESKSYLNGSLNQSNEENNRNKGR